MQVVILKTLFHDKLGTLNKGRVVDVPEPWASRWLKSGAVERYETKVVRENPLPIAGAAVPLSYSPAGQASTEPTLKPSKDGETKNGKGRARS